MEQAEANEKVVTDLKKKLKTKSKFYFSDMEKAVQKVVPTAKAREIKKAATALVQEEKLIYFSTGSTTMIQLAEEDVDSRIK